MGQMYTSSVIISNKPYITMRWKQAIVSCSGVFFALNERNGTFYHCSGSGCHRVSCHTLAWLTKKCNTGMTKSKDHSRYYPLPTKTVGCLKAFLTLSSLCNIPVWFIFFFLKGRLGKRLLNLPVTFLRIRRGYIKADFEVLAKLFYSMCVLPITIHHSFIFIYSSCDVIHSLINSSQKYWICFTIILLLLGDILTFHVIRCCYNSVKLLQV